MLPVNPHRSILSKHVGFTLIELLIVVGIISILASIAVVNFLEAQLRSKITRTKADMRSLSTAVESYRTDSNSYPYRQNTVSVQYLPEYRLRRRQLAAITTPIAYITNLPPDIFDKVSPSELALIEYWDPMQTSLVIKNFHRLRPSRWLDPGTAGWMMYSVGPDGYFGHTTNVPESLPGGSYPVSADPMERDALLGSMLYAYDPSNGTNSIGNIYNAQVGGLDQAGPIFTRRVRP